MRDDPNNGSKGDYPWPLSDNVFRNTVSVPKFFAKSYEQFTALTTNMLTDNKAYISGTTITAYARNRPSKYIAILVPKGRDPFGQHQG